MRNPETLLKIKSRIDQISLHKPKVIDVADGNVYRIIRTEDAGFSGFGEVYASEIKQNAVKGWKLHTKMTLNLVVISGLVRFVFCDHCNDFREEIIGLKQFSRITVPPGIWFAFQGLNSGRNVVLNVADITNDPEEVLSKNLADIAYRW